MGFAHEVPSDSTRLTLGHTDSYWLPSQKRSSGETVERLLDLSWPGEGTRRTVTGRRLELESLALDESQREVVPVLAPEESTRVKLRQAIYHDGELHTAHETDYL